MADQTPEKEMEMKIDTSGMNKEQEAALLVTEAGRSKWDKPSFAGGIYMGKFQPELITPFPEQSAEDKKIGTDLIARVEVFLKENVDPEEIDRTTELPQKVMEGLTAMNLWAMKIPKEYGGLGLSQVNYNRVMCLISSWCGATAVTLSAHQSIGIPQPLKMFGTPEQKKKYLPQIVNGAISAFALTEPGVGSDPAKMMTTATLTEDGNHYIINGEKLWCTNGTIADLVVVMARTPPLIKNGKEIPQITAFIVEKTMPGFEVTHRCDFMGIRGIQNGLLTFKNLKVPKENIILGLGKGLKLALTTLNAGRLTIPAASVGMAKQCLRMARIYSNYRVQWGQPIGKHEMVAEKLAFVASSTFAMEAVTWLASAMVDNGKHDIRIEAAMAKMYSSEVTWQITDTTMQIIGGRAYEKAASLIARGERPFSVERIMRDCRINRIIEGTSEIMHLFLAREALDPHMDIAKDIMIKNPIGKKFKALGPIMKFYIPWYFKQWFNKSLWAKYPEFPSKLGKHMAYVERTSHRLARRLFHAMAIHQAKLERKQMLLGRFVDIGSELFSISAVCSYTKMLLENNPSDKTPLHMADFYCNSSRRRISAHFSGVNCNQDKDVNKIRKAVMEGECKWQETEIIPIVEENPT